jgi:hypothetical protein
MPSALVDVPGQGHLIVWSTEPDHLGISTGTTSKGDNDPASYLARHWPDIADQIDKLVKVAHSITIRGIEYRLHGHAYVVSHFPTERGTDARQTIDYECDGWAMNWHEPHIHRAHEYKDATEPARNAARKLAVDAIGHFAHTDEGKALLVRSRLYVAHNRLARALTKLTEAYQASRDAEAERDAAVAEYAAAGGDL